MPSLIARIAFIVASLVVHESLAMEGTNSAPQEASESPAVPDDAYAPDQSEYQRWVGRLARRGTVGTARIRGQPLLLAVTTVHGDDQGEPDPRRMILGNVQIDEARLTVDGYATSQRHTSWGTKGGGSNDPIPAADLKRLEELLAILPDDTGRLPPAGRRLLLQAAVGDREIQRVYDLADTPETVWEILRLSRSGFCAKVHTLRAEHEIVAQESAHDGFLCVTPDRRRLLFKVGYGPLQFWDPVTRELLRARYERHSAADDFVFSSDGRMGAMLSMGTCTLVDSETWEKRFVLKELLIGDRQRSLSQPCFTSDSRHLVLRAGEPPLRVFELTSGRLVDRLPQIPEGALAYFPAPHTPQAVVQVGQAIELWDIAKQHPVARIAEAAHLYRAEFSPDDAHVAVSYVYRNDRDRRRLQIWSTTRGQLLHELRPFEQQQFGLAGALTWTPDGQHLLAATRLSSFYSSSGISVWSLQTGRHRGEFSAAAHDFVGFALLADSGQLVAGSTDGKLRFWDFQKGMTQIRDFEKTLSLTTQAR